MLRLQWELLSDIEQVNKAQLGKKVSRNGLLCEAAFPGVSLTHSPPLHPENAGGGLPASQQGRLSSPQSS